MKKTIVLSISTALLLFASTDVVISKYNTEKEDRKIEELNEQLTSATNISIENILILNQKKITLPNLKKKLIIFKVINNSTGEGKIVAFDEENNLVDYNSLKKEDRKIRFDKMGVMNEALLKKVSDGGDIPVMLQLAVKEKFIDKNKFDGKSEKLKEVALKEEDRVSSEAKKLFATIENEYNLKLSQKATFSGPFVSAVLPYTIVEKLSKDPRVIFMGTDKEKEIYDSVPLVNSLPATRTNLLHTHGFKGQNVKIAVLESGMPIVSNSCFHIADIQAISSSTNMHMTGSLGLISNRYNINSGECNAHWSGYAPLADIYLANVSDYKDRYEWAKTKGVNVVTMSWHLPSEETSGDLSSRDKYFDYQATHFPYPSIFTSAGNQAKENAFSSGKGYNFFGVGDIKNDWDSSRCNDGIALSSSFKNPNSPNNDREIPEIASPGSHHYLPGLGLYPPTNSFGGTSAATPITASITAVLMSLHPSLKSKPTVIRAILQAGANYQGADGSDFDPDIDGRDGAGMTNTHYSAIIGNKHEAGITPQYHAYDYGTMAYTDFSDTSFYFNKAWKIKVPLKKSRIRVALTWNSQTDDPLWWYTSELMGDLDLRLFDPLGNAVAVSASYDNNNEIIEFTPTIAGDYTIKILGFDIPKEKKITYSIAWTVHDELCN